MSSNTTPDEPGETSPQPGARLRDAIEILNGLRATTDDSDDGPVDEDLINQAPIVRLANVIIVNAIEASASEILLEPIRKNILWCVLKVTE